MRNTMFFILVLISMLISVPINSQTRALCSAPGVTLKYKRTISEGNTVTVHFTLSNFTNKDLNPIINGEEGTRFEVKKIEAYDDEGNYYDLDSKNMSVSIGNANIEGSRYASRKFTFPNEVTVKGVITFRNVSEYATSFSRISIPLRGFDVTDQSYQRGYIILKDVPISRDF
ncbi:hypothetical protein [Bacteroides sp.]|uniref:hypothetical protein n=1 Tax=Bacteroides sp. TaxID=29523 RepID=UPI00258E5B28|nr:hypothetical protein [Bacteroides sp.]